MCFTSRACWVSSRGSEKSRPCWAAANSRNPAEGSSGERLQEGTGFGRGEDLREWGSSLQKRGETLFAGGPGEQSEMNPLVGKSCYSRPPFFLPSNLSRRRRAFVSERPFKHKRREERCSPLHLSTGANHYFQPGMFFFCFFVLFFFFDSLFVQLDAQPVGGHGLPGLAREAAKARRAVRGVEGEEDAVAVRVGPHPGAD